ncbi:hypothetical protein BASA50_001300 [Batrachochytrium salamandrivorans]|uniref:Zn(2)-C6 fungal-type domain-containing protein n=1 Tax=Batrachochytrium salamandrivorans TaxID=1357716 RepID=A0ABQ8EYE2_9FUNG|nr:hypothetical protein BASA50_001300 [Batrachochytrium salamandrivorans]
MSETQRLSLRTALTCINCIAKKSKCDRLRPTCSACRKSGLLCSYKPRKQVVTAMTRQHKISNNASNNASDQPSSTAQTLQDRLQRLEEIVVKHQLSNDMSCNDPVNPATFTVTPTASDICQSYNAGSHPIYKVATHAALLAGKELKAYFIDSLRSTICLMSADQVSFCCAENPLVTFAICALAAMFAPDSLLPNHNRHELFLAYYKAARSGIATMLEQPKASSVFGLLMITIISCAERGPRDTYYYGSVVQMAMQLGLNSEARINKAPSEFHKSLCRSVWWSIYLLDRWLLTTEIGIEAVRDSDCKVPLPPSQFVLSLPPGHIADERANLEISLMASERPFIPSPPFLGVVGSRAVLAKIYGRIVLANRDAAALKSVMNPIVQISLERSLDDFAQLLPEVVRNSTLLSQPPESLPQDSISQEWKHSKWESVFIFATLLAARVALYRFTLLHRFETQPLELVMASKDFTESFRSVVAALELITTLKRNSAEFESLFVLFLAALFNISLVLPICYMMPLSAKEFLLVNQALEEFCRTMDVLSVRATPSPIYSRVIRTLCASRDKAYVIKAIKLAAKNMNLPQLHNLPSPLDNGASMLWDPKPPIQSDSLLLRTDNNKSMVDRTSLSFAQMGVSPITTMATLTTLPDTAIHIQTAQSSIVNLELPSVLFEALPNPQLQLQSQPVVLVPNLHQQQQQKHQRQQQQKQQKHQQNQQQNQQHILQHYLQIQQQLSDPTLLYPTAFQPLFPPQGIPTTDTLLPGADGLEPSTESAAPRQQ